MAILDFTSTASAPAKTQRMPFGNMTNPTGDRPKAKIWLNIGYETNGRFVNLPIGTPVDTMEAAEIRGQNEDWVKFQTARNNLLKALQALGTQLAPGQEIEVPNLVIKLRRVNADLDVSKETNEYSVDFLSLLTKAPAVQQAAE
jgi:hypothetical protein